MAGYISDFLKPKYEINIIPINWCPTSFFYFYFRGWKTLTLSVDGDFLDAINIASASVQTFYSLYHEKFAFTEPILSIDEDAAIKIKIGTMEIEKYEMMRETI